MNEQQDAHVKTWLKVMRRQRRRAAQRAWRAANHEHAKELGRKWYAANLEKIRERARERYKQNPTGKKLSSKKWKETHKTKVREMARNWYAKNPDKCHEATRKWAIAHPDHTRAYYHSYRANNREKRLAALQRRRVILGKNIVRPSDYAIINARTNGCCGICGKPVDPVLKWPDPFSKSYDHMMPLIKGGEHTSDNLQLAHLRCNLRKFTKLKFKVENSACLPT